MKQTWLERLDLPDEYALARSLVEIVGCERVLIEHHAGVVGYSERQISVRVKFGVVTVLGSALELKRMCGAQLIICGRIDAVQLERSVEK